MKQDRVIGLILVAFSGLMYYQASQLPPAMFGTLGADVFPKILFVLLALAGVILFIQGMTKKATPGKPVQGAASDSKAQPRGVAFYRNVIIGFASFMGYVILMDYLGYVISTLIFLPVLMWILGPKTKKSAVTIVLVTLGLTYGMQYGFANILKVFLPEGSVF